MSEENKNLKTKTGKIRKFCIWLGIFLLLIGITYPFLILSSGRTPGPLLAKAICFLCDVSLPLGGIGIILIFIGIYLKKLYPKKKILIVIFILLLILPSLKLIGTLLGKTAGRDVDRSISIIIEAEKKKDAEICNKIYPFSFFPSNLTIFLLGCETANNFLMDSYEGCITQVAIAKNDISLCKKLYPYTKDIYVNDIESCQNRVLTGVSDAHYFCKSWRVDVIGHPPSECYIKIALKTENYKVCKNIEDADMFNECIYRVAAKTDNIELCKELNQEGFYYKRGVYDNCEEDIKNKIKSKIGF